MTNNWSDPLASVLGGASSGSAMMSHPFQVAQNGAGGGTGLRAQAMAKLNPMGEGMSSMQPVGQPQFGAPTPGPNWQNMVNQFQQQIAAANAQFQQQQTAWQTQMQQMLQQQQAQQAAQANALGSAGATPYASSPAAGSPASGGGERLYGVQVPWDQYMNSYAMQSAQHALANGA